MTQDSAVPLDSVALDDEARALVIIDQTKLPRTVNVLSLTTQKEIYRAITTLQVRGAPAIGVAAAIGVYLASLDIETDNWDEFHSRFVLAKQYLASSRPTAVNLFWSLARMDDVAVRNKNLPVPEIKSLLRDEATRIHDEDIRVCRTIGEHGLGLIRDGWGILTHCNAGRLAAVRYGTALASLHLGRERGYNFKVFADETRPLLQGARLTAFELVEDGIDTTVICDNTAARVMKNGWIQAVLVGCDRMAANGDACNKIGTSGIAIIAHHYGVPFYVCAPTSTIDMNVSDGDGIVIEERAACEVAEMWYRERMVPEGADVYNPAFDVTPAGLITAVVTEHGVLRPPYGESLARLRTNVRFPQGDLD
jgi:methylthioribose-1-phosphate isomerase